MQVKNSEQVEDSDLVWLIMLVALSKYIQYIWQSEPHNQTVVTSKQRSIHAELKNGPPIYITEGWLLHMKHFLDVCHVAGSFILSFSAKKWTTYWMYFSSLTSNLGRLVIIRSIGRGSSRGLAQTPLLASICKNLVATKRKFFQLNFVHKDTLWVGYKCCLR